jgi:hypothetical protein
VLRVPVVVQQNAGAVWTCVGQNSAELIIFPEDMPSCPQKNLVYFFYWFDGGTCLLQRVAQWQRAKPAP